MHFPRDSDRQPEADTVAADAGEHPVADEVGVQPLDLSRAHSGQLEENGVDLRLAWRRHQRSSVYRGSSSPCFWTVNSDGKTSGSRSGSDTMSPNTSVRCATRHSPLRFSKRSR